VKRGEMMFGELPKCTMTSDLDGVGFSVHEVGWASAREKRG
jgi:hypothetical protein